MRTKTLFFVTALLAGWASAAGAQQATGQQAGEQAPTSPWHVTGQNWFDAGVRVTSTDGDRARFERYRDPRSGPFLDRLRFEKDTGTHIFSLALDNIGYRDQRLFGQVNMPGKVRLSVEWNQIPQFWSINSHTPYQNVGTADQTLPAGLAGKPFPATINALALDAFDTRARRDTLTVDLLYNATKNVDLDLHLATAKRTGDQPWAFSFGFGGAADTQAPVDTRTTDLTAGAEWSNDRGMLRVAYDGSWFSNTNEAFTVDNPLRAAPDLPNNSSRARSALWPSNNAHTVTGAAAINLPSHSRLNATVAIGNWRQDATLLPMTINSAIAQPTLPRSTAEADIRRVTTNISFVTRPANFLNVSARYRLYDFNDRTPEFFASTIVEYDAQVEPGSEELVPAHFSNRYNSFEAEGTITALRAVSFGAGYRLNDISYTTREVGSTRDNAVFATVNSMGLGVVSLHGTYEHARRRASDFSALALTELPDSGEYPGLRRYDVADRDRDSGTAMLQVMPANAFAISASITAARDTFPNQQFADTESFGLRRRTMTGYGLFFDASPRDTVIVSGGYGYQTYNTNQQSRQVTTAPTVPPTGPQLDPRRNWTVAEDEKVHYVAASVELTQIVPKTALRVTYDYNKSDSPYVYGILAGSPITAGVPATPGQPPVQLPPLNNRWHTATVDVRYFLKTNLAAGVTYWYDRYTVNDQWSMGANIEDRQAVPGLLLLGYGFRPYTANSVWLRVQYFF